MPVMPGPVSYNEYGEGLYIQKAKIIRAAIRWYYWIENGEKNTSLPPIQLANAVNELLSKYPRSGKEQESE